MLLYAYRCLFISIFPWRAVAKKESSCVSTRARARTRSKEPARVKHVYLFKCNIHFILFATSCKFLACTRGNTIFPSSQATTTRDTNRKISPTARCFSSNLFSSLTTVRYSRAHLSAALFTMKLRSYYLVAQTIRTTKYVSKVEVLVVV